MRTSEPAAVANGGAAKCLVLRQPDDWHVHLRDGAMLAATVNETAHQFARAIVMPNLDPPVTTAVAAEAYRARILAALAPGAAFTPLMTAYLTDAIDPGEIGRGFRSGVFTAAKLYPAHATTNAAHGVTDVRRIYPVLELMQRIGMPLLLHGEVTDRHVDVFDREAVFIDRVLTKLVADFPALKLVFEHITTEEAVAFVEAAGPNLGATITPHHLMFNRSAMFEGGIRPHLYCLPVAKRERHRLAPRRDLGQPQVLPRHGLGAARGRRQRVRLRLCRYLQCARGASELCHCFRRGRSARQARSLRRRAWSPLLRHASQRGFNCARPDTVAGSIDLRRRWQPRCAVSGWRDTWLDVQKDKPTMRGKNDVTKAWHPYAGRSAVLATMHRKEEAIAPTLMSSLGLIVTSP